MRVKEDSLIVSNALVYTERIHHTLWYDTAKEIMSQLNRGEVYCTTPFVFQTKSGFGLADSGIYTYYFGINTEVEETDFVRQMDLIIHPALSVRSADLIEIDEAYEALENYAKENGLKIDSNYYHVCFEIEGLPGIMMDIYAAIERNEK